MSEIKPEDLLKDRRVVDEINRHLWIESEKAGFDVGFDRASKDWIDRFSSDWVRYNMPDRAPRSKTGTRRKARRAKSYLFF